MEIYSKPQLKYIHRGEKLLTCTVCIEETQKRATGLGCVRVHRLVSILGIVLLPHRSTDWLHCPADEHCAPALPFLSFFILLLLLLLLLVPLCFCHSNRSNIYPRWCASSSLSGGEGRKAGTVTRGISRRANLVTKWPGRESFHPIQNR